MASIPVMIGGVLNYTTAFVGGSSQSIWVETSAEEEKKKHDLAVYKYHAAYKKFQENWTKLLDWITTNGRVKEQSKQNFVDVDYALKLHNKAHNQALDFKGFFLGLKGF